MPNLTNGSLSHATLAAFNPWLILNTPQMNPLHYGFPGMMSPMSMPSKGERHAILAKPAVPFAEILKENADKQGLSYGDYLVALAAEALEMPQFAPKPRRRREDQLDMPREVDSAAA